MIYIIISNIGLALMTLILYFRYSHFRITSTFKIRDLEKRLNREITDKEALSAGLTNEVKTEVEQVKQLLRAIDELRKEKEEEAKLRLEAEKQIDLALQKTQDIQKRMSDWKAVQDAAMEDAKSAVLKMGADLFDKMTKVQKDEAVESRTAVEKSVKNVYNYLDTISKNVEEFKQKNDLVSAKLDKAVASAGIGMMTKSLNGEKSVSGSTSAAMSDPVSKQIINKVLEDIKISGHVANKIYVTQSTLKADQSKLFLCDIGFLKDDIFYAMDFKALRYFQEYDKAKATNKIAATDALKQKLSKYIAYIANPKYKAAINKIASDLQIKSKSLKVVFIVNNKSDIAILKETKYSEQIEKAGLEIFDLDKVTDLVL